MDAETEKKRKSGLTRDVIVDTAYRMIDRDGMGAFTMRALGAELGVSAMAFYAHFPRARRCWWRCSRASWKRSTPIRCRESGGTTRCGAR